MQLQLELQVVGGVEINQALASKSKKYMGQLRALTRNYGESTKQLTQFLCPLDTGYMRGKVKTVYHFSETALYYETGWSADDFILVGKPFYPFFQEMGTKNMRAQPSLNPAFRDQAPLYKADVAALTAREWARLRS